MHVVRGRLLCPCIWRVYVFPPALADVPALYKSAKKKLKRPRSFPMAASGPAPSERPSPRTTWHYASMSVNPRSLEFPRPRVRRATFL
ncbi:hypothetical protein B0H17DRAFT_569122 [Mycena rosella]|uniref:Secreted protein n=1 Tax=Mycena rosella TaxID=1033263 RepID=A0AAD7GWA7_MYCRO|nr:hypothetical protein B0H17DRAFT_569122 [Mycena rosella]